MKILQYIFFLLLFVVFSQTSFAQDGECSFSADQGGFDYTVDFELGINDIQLTQNGTTCNAQVDVDYLISLTENSASPFGPVFFINLVVGCGAINDNIDITVPGGNLGGANTSVMGILSFGDFDFPMTDCSTLMTSCDVSVTMTGGGGLNEFESPCTTISQACARSVF